MRNIRTRNKAGLPKLFRETIDEPAGYQKGFEVRTPETPIRALKHRFKKLSVKEDVTEVTAMATAKPTLEEKLKELIQ